LLIIVEHFECLRLASTEDSGRIGVVYRVAYNGDIVGIMDLRTGCVHGLARDGGALGMTDLRRCVYRLGRNGEVLCDFGGMGGDMHLQVTWGNGDVWLRRDVLRQVQICCVDPEAPLCYGENGNNRHSRL